MQIQLLFRGIFNETFAQNCIQKAKHTFTAPMIATELLFAAAQAEYIEVYRQSLSIIEEVHIDILGITFGFLRDCS